MRASGERSTSAPSASVTTTELRKIAVARRVARVANRGDRSRVADDPFGEQIAGCEIEVVAGGAHRDRDDPLDAPARIEVLDPDLERLLDGERVLRQRAIDAVYFAHGHLDHPLVHGSQSLPRVLG